MHSFEEILQEGAITHSYMLISRANNFTDWMEQHFIGDKMDEHMTEYAGIMARCYMRSADNRRRMKAEIKQQEEYFIKYFNLTADDLIKKLESYRS